VGEAGLSHREEIAVTMLVLPYFLWAFIFFVVALVLIIKHWPLRRWLLRSGIISVIAILFLGAFAYLASWLGIS
jgi:hypothetical protein